MGAAGAGFANFKAWSSLATAVGFFAIPYLSLFAKIMALLVCLPLVIATVVCVHTCIARLDNDDHDDARKRRASMS